MPEVKAYLPAVQFAQSVWPSALVVVHVADVDLPAEHDEHDERGGGSNVNRATAVIGVRPPTVYSGEHSQEEVSQSQSRECPWYAMLTDAAPIELAVIKDVSWHSKKVQS